jgi:hypothetical protein
VTGLVRDEPEELAAALHDVRDLDPAACRAHVAARFDVDGLGAGYEAAYRKALTPDGALTALRRDYAALDSALDRVYESNVDEGPALHASGDRG